MDNLHGAFITYGEHRAYVALPESPGPHRAVLLYMEAFGVNNYIASECDRLARSGFLAIAPDFFDGRTFGYGDFEQIRPMLQGRSDADWLAYIRDAIGWLDARHDVVKAPLGVLGFCMGGRLAFLSAVEFPERIGAAVAFYGGGIAPDEPSLGRPPLIGRAEELRAPIMFHYGADDAGITPVEHGRIAQTLSAGKKKFSMHLYPDAGHGFASRDRDSYRGAVAEEAWGWSLEFLRAALP
ncbi:MAG: dienelactone hydrolase family protein [Candidatus Eremiobacteraeota bacterium]|nr:dienelactone hydrolase family protein [Candidatus Eremiobacteraeota bacterium]